MTYQIPAADVKHHKLEAALGLQSAQVQRRWQQRISRFYWLSRPYYVVLILFALAYHYLQIDDYLLLQAFVYVTMVYIMARSSHAKRYWLRRVQQLL